MRISDWSSDVCSSDLVGNGEEVAEALEPRLVRHVRGMCRHNELHRPRPISVQLRHERGRDTLELPDEDLLHLRMKVRLRRSEEHTSELQSLMRISYAVFCLKKKKTKRKTVKHKVTHTLKTTRKRTR